MKNKIDKILRVDHAGEVGAAKIYEGQLKVLGKTDVGPMIQHMKDQEKEHLDTFHDLLNENSLDQLLSKSPIRCDETQFELLNISLAGWNGILSIIIFIILSYLLYKTYKETK